MANTETLTTLYTRHRTKTNKKRNKKTEEMSITDSTKNKNTVWNNWEEKETKIIRYPYS